MDEDYDMEREGKFVSENSTERSAAPVVTEMRPSDNDGDCNGSATIGDSVSTTSVENVSTSPARAIPRSAGVSGLSSSGGCVRGEKILTSWNYSFSRVRRNQGFVYTKRMRLQKIDRR